MAIPNKLKCYGYHVIIALDQLFNAATAEEIEAIFVQYEVTHGA